MSPLQIRELSPAELERVREVDRSESIERRYRQTDGVLESYEDPMVMESDSAFWDSHLESWRDAAQSGAKSFGAFDGDRLAGFAILQPGVAPEQAQILALYVSAEYRLSGIAKSLFLEAQQAAKKSGAKSLVVAATPTGSAVGFYLSQGFEPSAAPIAGLLAAEAEDIHMAKRLR